MEFHPRPRCLLFRCIVFAANLAVSAETKETGIQGLRSTMVVCWRQPQTPELCTIPELLSNMLFKTDAPDRKL